LSVDDDKIWNFVLENGYYTFRTVPGKQVGFISGSDGKITKVEFKEF